MMDLFTMPEFRRFKIFYVLLFALVMISCNTNDTALPVIPETEDQFVGLNDDKYVLFNEITGIFNNPSDIYYSFADNFIYVADTDNDRIVMLDWGGNVQGISQTIPHPEAVTQNDSLQLLIVNKSNSIYRIDLFRHRHRIADAPVEIVFTRETEPTQQFTGISVHNKFEYYVTAIDPADTANVRNSSFIFDFGKNHTLKGPLPLFNDGTGLFSALIPTSIISLREQFLDFSAQETTPAFIFTQQGFTSLFTNYFKVQVITTAVVEGSVILIPNQGINSSENGLYNPEKFYIPEDVALDKDRNIYVVDSGSPNPANSKKAAFYRFAENGLERYSYIGDGSNDDNITFNNPKGIAVTPDPNAVLPLVYIADSGNDRILMFILSSDL